jgi:hypothetical protein
MTVRAGGLDVASPVLAGLVLAVLGIATATPAQACFDWGYSGVTSNGWPYATTGFASYPAYSYRSCGGTTYHIQGWGECSGYGPCGWAPLPPLVLQAPVPEVAATDAVSEERLMVRRRPARRQ